MLSILVPVIFKAVCSVAMEAFVAQAMLLQSGIDEFLVAYISPVMVDISQLYKARDEESASAMVPLIFPTKPFHLKFTVVAFIVRLEMVPPEVLSIVPFKLGVGIVLLV